MNLHPMAKSSSKSQLKGKFCISLTATHRPYTSWIRSGENEEKVDHTGEPNKKKGKLQKKSMLSFNEDEEDEEYR